MQLSRSQDAGSLPRLEMVAEGLIFDARHAEVEEATNYNGSLLPLASGVLLAGWQCGREKHTPTNTLRIAQSVDHGQSWQVLAWRFDPHWPVSCLVLPFIARGGSVAADPLCAAW